MAGPTPSASLVLNEVIHLLAVPSPSANPAEPNPEVVIVWMKSESIGCTKSKCSPAQSSDKVNVIQGKWWIFWLCQAQVPVRLNQVLKWMMKLLLSKWIDACFGCAKSKSQPGWSKWLRSWFWLNEMIKLMAAPSPNASLVNPSDERYGWSNYRASLIEIKEDWEMYWKLWFQRIKSPGLNIAGSIPPQTAPMLHLRSLLIHHEEAKISYDVLLPARVSLFKSNLLVFHSNSSVPTKQ